MMRRKEPVMSRRILAVMLALCLLVSGCTAVKLGPSAGITVTDSLGREVTVVPSPAKVVTLSHSLADLWYTSGGDLLGITQDTLEQRDMPFDPWEMEVIGTVKSPNTEKILSMVPDLVLYSPDIAGQREAAAILEKAGIPCYAAIIDTFARYKEVLADMTALTDCPHLYEKYGTNAEEEISAMLSLVPADEKPRVLFLRASSSSVKAKAEGHVVCDILAAAGADNIGASEDSLLEDVSLEAVLEADPEYLFIATMGEADEAVSHLEDTFFSSPVWGQLTAVRDAHVYILPEDLFHHKPNTQWSYAYVHILELLYPEVFGS